MKSFGAVQRLIVGATILVAAAGVLSSPAVAQVPGATYNGAFTSQTGIQHFFGGIDLLWGTKTALPPDAPISFTVSPDGSRITSVTIPSPIRGAYVGYGSGSSAYCEFFFYEPVPVSIPITNHAFSRSTKIFGNVWMSFTGSFTGANGAQGVSPENVPGGAHGAGLRVAESNYPNSYDVPLQDKCTSGYIPWTASTTVYEAKINKVTVSGPTKVRKGKNAIYKVKISNSGNATAEGVRLKVSGRGVSFNTSVGKVSAAATRTVKVRLKPRKTGRVKVTFKVTSSNAGGKTVSKTITVKK